MYKQMLIEQAFKFLHVRGQNLFVSTLGSKIRSACCLTFEICIGILMVMGMLQQLNDIYAFLESITAFSTLIETVVKAILLIIHKHKFLSGISYLNQFWPSDKFGETFSRKLLGYRRFAQNVLKLFRIVITVTGTLYLMKPIFEHKRMLPITQIILCKFEEDSCYLFYYALQVSGLFTQLITLVGFDGLFFTLLFCGYTELEQIKNGLVNLDVNGKASTSEKELLQQTSEIIEHHNFVLEYINNFDRLFQIPLLVLFGVSIFSLCSVLFITTAAGFPPSTSTLIRGGPYALSVFAQILIYSAVGEKIVEQTEDVAQVAYEIDWYITYRPKFRKMLSLIMHRSQKASQITAGGVWYLNMNTFGQILKGSMSLLAFMQTIYAKKRNQKAMLS